MPQPRVPHDFRLDARRQALVVDNLPRAYQLSRRMVRTRDDATRHDADSAAVDGILRAAQMYDFRPGVKFCTYASWWIVQSLQRWAETERRQKHLRWGHAVLPLLDSGELGFDDPPARSGLPDRRGLSPPARVALDEEVARVRSSLGGPEARYWKILWLRYAEGMKYGEIGDVLGISKERVRQLIKCAIRRALRSRRLRRGKV